MFWVSSKSVKRVPRCGGWNMPFSLHWPLAYTTACTSVLYKPWYPECWHYDYIVTSTQTMLSGAYHDQTDADLSPRSKRSIYLPARVDNVRAVGVETRSTITLLKRSRRDSTCDEKAEVVTRQWSLVIVGGRAAGRQSVMFDDNYRCHRCQSCCASSTRRTLLLREYRLPRHIGWWVDITFSNSTRLRWYSANLRSTEFFS